MKDIAIKTKDLKNELKCELAQYGYSTNDEALDLLITFILTKLVILEEKLNSVNIKDE